MEGASSVLQDGTARAPSSGRRLQLMEVLEFGSPASRAGTSWVLICPVSALCLVWVASAHWGFSPPACSLGHAPQLCFARWPGECAADLRRLSRCCLQT